MKRRRGKHGRRGSAAPDVDPLAVLLRAASIAGSGRAVCVRLSREPRLAIVLASAGVSISIDLQRDLAHVAAVGRRASKGDR